MFSDYGWTDELNETREVLKVLRRIQALPKEEWEDKLKEEIKAYEERYNAAKAQV